MELSSNSAVTSGGSGALTVTLALSSSPSVMELSPNDALTVGGS